MQAPWIFSSTFLPGAGESIDFVLQDRGQAIHGTFADGSFHSRWADYDPERVQSWRGADPDLPAAPTAICPAALTGSFVATLRRRLAATLGLVPKTVPTASTHRRRKAQTMSVTADLQPHVAALHVDVDRISS